MTRRDQIFTSAVLIMAVCWHLGVLAPVALAGSKTILASVLETPVAGTLQLGPATATKVEVGASDIETDLNGNTVSPDDAMTYQGTGKDTFVEGELSTLTDNVATEVFSITSGDNDAGGVVVDYFVRATDGTENQAEVGTVQIAIVDDAGGVVASTVGEISTQALSSGTLTTDWSVTTTDDQSLEVTLDADSSLTTTTFTCRFRVVGSGDVLLTVP